MYGSCSLCEWNSITHPDFLSPVSSTWCYYFGIHTSLPQCLYQSFNFFFKCWSFPWWVHIVIFICVFVDVIWVVFVWGHLQIKLLWMPMDDSGFSGKHLWVWHLGHSVCEYMVGHVNHCFLKFSIFFLKLVDFTSQLQFPSLLSSQSSPTSLSYPHPLFPFSSEKRRLPTDVNQP